MVLTVFSGIRPENGHFFKIREQGKGDLGTDIGDHEGPHDMAQFLYGAHAAHGTVTDESGRLVVPFMKEVIECVFERSRWRVVVFGCNEYETVERCDFFGPYAGMGMAVMT